MVVHRRSSGVRLRRNAGDRFVKVIAAIVIGAGLAAGLTARFALSDHASGLTHPRQPSLFFRAGGSIELGSSGVFGVAHNAGDTPGAARVAVSHGAEVVEIDAVAAHGKLMAAHDKPLPLFGFLKLRAPALDRVWAVARNARAIELDLKQSSPLFLDPLIDFVRAHRGPQLIVASRSTATLKALRRETPWVVRFLSIGFGYQLERLRVDDSLKGVVQGVSVRQDLLDEATTRFLKRRHLVILAWVVDDWSRAKELVGYGVDGIATNNLAIIDSLAHSSTRNALQILGAERGP